MDLEFNIRIFIGKGAITEAYERLLLDAIIGDASLFNRSDHLELAWELIDPIIAAWEDPNGPALATYEPGSCGPIEADALLSSDSKKWNQACCHL